MKSPPYIPHVRVHMRDWKLQTVDERDRIVQAWTRFLVGCVFVAVFAVVFVVMAVKAGAA